MSEDIEKVAKRLREIVTSFPEDQSDLDRAADALEALAAEHDQMLIDLEEYRRDVAKLTDECDRLKAAIRLIASHGDEPGALSWDLDKVLTLVDGAYKLRPR